MDYTDTDLVSKIAGLESALARGVMSVQMDGRMVTYPSAGSLLQALTYFRGLLNTVRGQAQQRPRQFVAVGSKGLCS